MTNEPEAKTVPDIVDRLRWTHVEDTMRDAADEIEDLRDKVEGLLCLITEWADAEEGYFDIGTEEGQRKVDRLDAAEDALRKAVGR